MLIFSLIFSISAFISLITLSICSKTMQVAELILIDSRSRFCGFWFFTFKFFLSFFPGLKMFFVVPPFDKFWSAPGFLFPISEVMLFQMSKSGLFSSVAGSCFRFWPEETGFCSKTPLTLYNY